MSSLASFVIAVVSIVGGISCGYLLRKTGLLAERYAPRFSFVVIIIAAPLISFLSIWPTPLQSSVSLLPCIQALTFLVLVPVSLLVGRLHHASTIDRGTLSLACALSNNGYTVGGLICYLLLGSEGLALAQIYIVLWNPLIVLVVFPLASHFGTGSHGQTLGRIIFNGLWNVRSICAIGVVAGIVFSLQKIPYPGWIKTYHLLRILVIAGTFTSFCVVGLTLHFGQIRRYTRMYLSHAAVRFMVAPSLSLLAVILFGLKFNEVPTLVVLIQGFMPTAVNTVLISNLFHLNARLASALLVVNTGIFLVVILPLLVFVIG